MLLNEKGDFRAAWECLYKCEEVLSKLKTIKTNIAEGLGIRLYYEMTIAAQGLGDTQNQIKYATLILKEDNTQKGVLIPYIRVLKRNDISDSEVIGLLQKLYDFTSVKDKLFIVRAAKDAGVISLAQDVMAMITEEERRWMSGGG